MLFHRKLYNRFLPYRVPFGNAPGTWCGILDIRDFLTQPAILRQEVAERHHRHGGRIGVVCVRSQFHSRESPKILYPITRTRCIAEQNPDHCREI